MQTNVASLRSQRNLAKATNSFTGSIEKLSSGLRINKAGDDAARSAISSQMSAQERGLLQAKRNANDAISLIQDTESATAHLGDVVTRMRELAVQASNEGTMDSTERGYLLGDPDARAGSSGGYGRYYAATGSQKVGYRVSHPAQTGRADQP